MTDKIDASEGSESRPMTQILKPCPFCGSANVDAKGWASTETSGPACDDCGGAAGSAHWPNAENIRAWNTRHSDPDELREALVEFVEADNRDREIAGLRSALARVVAKDVIHGTPKHEFVQAVADLSLIAGAEDAGGDLADYWKELLETLRAGAQRILNRTALSRNVGDVG